MIKPTPAQVRELKRNNLRYPDHLVAIPSGLWPDMRDAPGGGTGSIVLSAMRSRAFMAVVWLEPSGFTRLSVNRTEWDERQGRFRDDISWDDIQRLKAEVGYGEAWAVEIYPADNEIINVANMRHIFLLGEAPACAWRSPRRDVAA